MLLLFSIPSFVLIPILRALNYFVLYKNGLPSLPPAGWGQPAHWVLPILVLTAATLGYIARLTRSSMLEVLGEDYIRTAKGKGLIPRRIIYIHVLRNALLPLITVIGPSLAFFWLPAHSSSRISLVFRVSDTSPFNRLDNVITQ